MKEPEFYSGRPQTFVKHFFLENYLEKVAYHILWSRQDFVYIDGFSGPWQSKDDAYEDTSFVIALNKLRNVQQGMKLRDKKVKVRCLFIEKDPSTFKKLESAVSSISDIETKVLRGSFENLTRETVVFIGNSFSLIFIDPKGWTGFSLPKISPLLNLPGEVLINFMFDHINRFLTDPRPETAATFDPMFGDSNWYDDFVEQTAHGHSREQAVLSVYMDRLRKAGNYQYVTSTRIKKPLADRSYFHLIYATRHWKGIFEFRNVEKKTAPIQEQVRRIAKSRAKHEKRSKKTGMGDLFGASEQDGNPLLFEDERDIRLEEGWKKFESILMKQSRTKYELLAGEVLEIPLVWRSDLNSWVKEKQASRKIQIEGISPREKTPKPGHVIVRVN